MRFSFLFFVNAVALGVGLAMDAFSVSLANGLHEPDMKRKRICLIAGVFGAFQTLMPLAGWFCVRKAAEAFREFQRFIPWIALILLLFIGGKMVAEGIRSRGETAEEGTEKPSVGFTGLLVQGVATSIDALSVGFTIAAYDALQAVAESLIIGFVTFAICVAGVLLGRKFGMKLAGKATILGGCILILIGLEIFLTGILG